MTATPKISIGLPVYNGEAFLSRSVEALLSQTFADFELIVSDNASTDGTQEICRGYMAGDGRIRYYRAERNRGAAWNHNRTFELSTAPYFKWAAADDVCAPAFLERCLAALEFDSRAVLAHPRTVDVDTNNDAVRHHEYRLATNQSQAFLRFRELVTASHDCFHIYGLIRADILRETPLIGPYTSSDRVLLAELSLYGTFAEVDEYLFRHGEHPGRSMNLLPNRLTRAAWFDPGNADRLIFPSWRVGAEYLRAIRRSPLSITDRRRCLAQMAMWTKNNVEPLARDLPPAARFLRDRLGRTVTGSRPG